MELVRVVVKEGEETGMSHIEYHLRITYREFQRTSGFEGSGTSRPGAGAGTAAVLRVRGQKNSHDPLQGSLTTLVKACEGLQQRTRTLYKHLTSLCALHTALMGEMGNGDRGAELLPLFPDPFDLGTLEESILRVRSDKLMPRFKANAALKELSSRVRLYLGGLLPSLEALKASPGKGEDLYHRLVVALNRALSTCDRVGRKRLGDDLVLSMTVADVAGRELGNWAEDEEQLKKQRGRCMGCGRSIGAEYMGMSKNYSPCRFTNGLFCRSNCHMDVHCVIPRRAVHHWDLSGHRVCQAAAAFLDATQFLPAIRLSVANPDIFLERQPLRRTRSLRTQLCLLRDSILAPRQHDCCEEGRQILSTLLEGRQYLAMDPDLYSIEDLLRVKNGSLQEFLEEAVATLSEHVVGGCESCEATSAQVCGACWGGDPVYAFETARVVRCRGCAELFHRSCVGVDGKGGSLTTREAKGEGEEDFECSKCAKDTQGLWRSLQDRLDELGYHPSGSSSFSLY
ncbi:unnamed protein product [Discosporangium mesarthrocarpum]